ncbi:MAG: hypothetical protein ACQETB_13230 [Halobacteriota archaeon]
MSTESARDNWIDRIVRPFANATGAVRATLREPTSKLGFAGVTAVYLIVYLYAIGHLGWAITFGAVGIDTVDEPMTRLFEATGPYQYEPIALVELYAIELLVSPVNIALGCAIALLVAANATLAYAAWRAPAACGIESPSRASVGIAAGVPALLSGTVCCGPAIVLVVGVQATAGLLGLFAWLMPVAVVSLLASVAYVGYLVDPAAIE